VPLRVAVGRAALPASGASATVSHPADNNAANDTGADEDREVTHIDLSSALEHTGDFRVGGRGTYIGAVRNLGTSSTVGPVRAALTFGDGLSPVSAGGDGWSCTLGDIVRCTRPVLAAGQAASPIRVDVEIGSAAAPRTVPSMRVTTLDDTDAGNDVANDATAVVSGDVQPLKLVFPRGDISVNGLALNLGEFGSVILEGTIAPDGGVVFPASKMQSPQFEIQSGSGIMASLLLTEDATGTIERTTGQIKLRLKARIAVSGTVIPPGCGCRQRCGPRSTSTRSSPAVGDASGSPINSGNGEVTLVNATFKVPTAAGCGDLGDTFNQLIGLPAPAGKNRIVLGGTYEGPAAGVSDPGKASVPAVVKAPSTAGPVKVAKAAFTVLSQAERDRRRRPAAHGQPVRERQAQGDDEAQDRRRQEAHRAQGAVDEPAEGPPEDRPIGFPKAVAKQLRAALKAKKKIAATITTVVTGADRKSEKAAHKITVTG
jgi:hypothetical protein